MGLLRDALSGAMQQRGAQGQASPGWAPCYGIFHQQQQYPQGNGQQYLYSQQTSYGPPAFTNQYYSSQAPYPTSAYRQSPFPAPPPLPPHRSPTHSPDPKPPLYDDFSSTPCETDPKTTSTLSRPIALPQINFGEGVPFVRGYSTDLAGFGITETQFFQFVDSVNMSIIPNAEAQIVNKVAGLAGWFVPGAGGIALSALQIGAQIGGAVQLKSATASCLSRANQEIFNPVGLEVLICTSQDLDYTIGQPISSQGQYRPASFGVDSFGNQMSGGQFGASYMQRLEAYGPFIAPLTTILPPVMNAGRLDISAQLGARLSNKQQAKALEKATKVMSKGKSKKAMNLEKNYNWLLIRPINSVPQSY